MAGRHMLIVSSECPALGDDMFFAAAASELAISLEQFGEWTSKGSPHSPLLQNPTQAGLRAAITDAFAAAAESNATLLIGFVGHALSSSATSFSLMAVDSTPSDHSMDFNLTAEIPDLLDRAGGAIDGLVLLIDGGEAPAILEQGAGGYGNTQVEVLAASSAGRIRHCRFSFALAQILHDGIPDAGPQLACADVLKVLGEKIGDSSHASYSARSQTQPIWLAENQYRLDERRPPVVHHRSEVLMLPSFTNDDALGPDRLGIDTDARALAALIASKQLEPPLAIAVYGEWGSGKTFFMRRVEYHIDRLTRGASAAMFETGVRPIRFGAWHYARGHIWASLLEHIFSTLCPPDSTTEQTFEEITAQIPIIQETVAAADQKINATQQRIDDLDSELDSMRQQHQQAIRSLGSVRGRDILQAVTTDEAVRTPFDSALDEMGIQAATDSTRNLLDATRTASALATRTSFLATSGKHWYSSPLAAAVAVAILVGTATAVSAALAPDIWRTIGTVITPLATVGATAAAWIGRQSVLARRLLEPAERLQQQIEGRIEQARLAQATELAELEAAADAAQIQLAAANDEKATALADLAAARHAREELTPARLLERYIAEMAASGEYTEHLGVVGMAHRHLRGLSDRLREASADPAVSIKRIVLYIDDLDRCSYETIVTVLEAVHLLLAMPLFVVVVGVDTGSLDRALREAHPQMLEPAGPAPTPSDYLEKIFQLSYTIPKMTPEGCQAVLREAATTSRASSSTPYPSDILRPGLDVFPGEDEHPEVGSASDDNHSSATATTTPPQPVSYSQLAQALALDENDLDTLDLVAPLVAATPRRAKRFLNTYLVVRARLSAVPHDPAALAVLVAVLIGFPDTFGRQLLRTDPATTAESLRNWLRSNDIDNPTELARISNFLEVANHLSHMPMPTILAQLALVRSFVARELEQSRRR